MEKTTVRLQGKIAVIFGAGGDVGSAIARAFAEQGAIVFLSGRSISNVARVAENIENAGGVAHVEDVDALDEHVVNSYLDKVAAEAGRIDIVFNAVGPQAKDYNNGTNTMELPIEKFMLPLNTIVSSQFITSRSAARYMKQQRSGVIILISSIPAKGHAPNVAAIGAAFGAVESLVRCLAADFGPSGVRVTGLRTAGMTDTRTIEQTFENVGKAMGIPAKQVVSVMEQKT
ncbi:MAG: SDR family oxidoreductase [Segetibacter sp.]